MSVTLTLRVNELNLEYTEQPKFLTIKYNGSFVGKILGNTISNITRTEINIEFLDDVPEVLMIYSGNIEILGISTMDINFERIKGSYAVLINDEIQRINAKWDESTMKWEDYNQSNKYHRPVMSMIEYGVGDDVVYKEARGKQLAELPLRQKTMLNKIRGNYGDK